MNRLSEWLKKYFIPHKENSYKPHFLRRESALLMFLIVLIIELVFLLQVFVVAPKENFMAAVLPGALTMLTNEEREAYNAAPLEENDLLERAAQMKAEDMAARGYFAHVSPDGKTPWYWLDQVGYEYQIAGENLAVNFFESEDVAEAWMNSPSHRANIVERDYREVGIGVASGTYEGARTVFVAQFFGTPIARASTDLEVKPPSGAAGVERPTQTARQEPAPQRPVNSTQATQGTTAPTRTQVLGEATSENEYSSVTSFISSLQNDLKQLIQKFLSSPRKDVTYTYATILVILIAALTLAIVVKSAIQHVVLLARGFALVAFIIGLLYVNNTFLGQGAEVPADSVSASVISSN